MNNNFSLFFSCAIKRQFVILKILVVAKTVLVNKLNFICEDVTHASTFLVKIFDDARSINTRKIF